MNSNINVKKAGRASLRVRWEINDVKWRDEIMIYENERASKESRVRFV